MYDKNTKIACLELKYPKNGQYPEQMYSFCKDIKFLEQLKEIGFSKCIFLAIVDDKKFYAEEGKIDGIYKYFRSNKLLNGRIIKPTGYKNSFLDLLGEYKIIWKPISNTDYFYFLLEI